ncbi:YbaN family protein [Orrella sp. JC864]|uniref:YbaN family protein n=1 Tax=Orrella sp. JC864 TaxID=3120298 RepID=UPI00300A02EC
MTPDRQAEGAWARWVRRGYFALGMGLLALAVVGAFLPVMPSTIFVILAAACFGKASPRWEAWLLNHPRFGPALVAWREQGAISARGKCMAVGGISLGLLLFWLGARPGWLLGGAVSAGMLGCALWLATRPAPRPGDGPAAKAE